MSTSSGSPEPTEATSSLSPNNEPMPSQAANAHPPPAQPKSWLGQAAKPDRLDVSIDDVEHFRIWKRRWDGYYALSGLSQVDNLTQYHVLMSCLADETIRRVVDNLPLQNGEHQSVTAIVALLEKHMKGHTNIVVEHRNFLCRQQQLGERFDDFLTALRDLSRNCSFCSPCRETLLRDRIVIGTHDTEVVQRLLAEKDLTLEDAIRICRSEEAVKRDTMSLSADSFGEPVPVTASANRLGARPPRPDSPWTGRNTPPPPPCRPAVPILWWTATCSAKTMPCFQRAMHEMWQNAPFRDSQHVEAQPRARSQTRQNKSPARRGRLRGHRGD